jgi:hypothetical protein
MEDKKKEPQITEGKSWLDEVLEEWSGWSGKRQEKKTADAVRNLPKAARHLHEKNGMPSVKTAEETIRRKREAHEAANRPPMLDTIFSALLIMFMGLFEGIVLVVGGFFNYVGRYAWWLIFLAIWWVPSEWYSTATDKVDEVVNTQTVEETTDSLGQILNELTDALDGLRIDIKINDDQVIEFGTPQAKQEAADAPTDTPKQETANE